MSNLRRYGLCLLVILCAACIYLLSVHLDYLRYSNEVIEEMMYFPSGRFTRITSMGFQTVVADLLWLRGIQYYGAHRKTDKYYPLAEHIFQTIVDLDPHFLNAYRFGSFVLSQDMGQPDLAINLLKLGCRKNWWAWQPFFDLGFIYYIDLNQPLKAARYFNLSSRLPNAPEITRRFCAFAFRKAGRNQIAKRLWAEIYRSTSNKVMKQTALYVLKNIELDEALALIQDALEKYKSEYGSLPENVGDLVRTGYLVRLPEEPFGGYFFIDEASQSVVSSTRCRTEADRLVRFLKRKITQFESTEGYLPHSLSELKQMGYVDEIPNVAGIRLEYSPETGELRYATLLPEGK